MMSRQRRSFAHTFFLFSILPFLRPFFSFLPSSLFPRKSLSPGGLVSGGLGVGKLVLRTGPPRLGDTSARACPETPGTEMLLNGS